MTVIDWHKNIYDSSEGKPEPGRYVLVRHKTYNNKLIILTKAWEWSPITNTWIHHGAELEDHRVQEWSYLE